MTALIRDILEALALIIRGDPEVWFVTAVSLEVSMSALALAALIGVPLERFGGGDLWYRGVAALSTG